MAFSTKECAWAQTSMKLLGATLTGIRGFEFQKNIEKELIFAAGDEAIDITQGNKSVSGTLTILKHELDKLNDAAQAAGFEDISDVPHTAILITCAFKLNATTPVRIIETTLGAAFTGFTVGQKQNAKMTEVPLPFIAPKLVLRKGA
ncbi:MAG: hypothetical protein ACT4OJ_08790 [Bacteroidota bacterium]